MNRLEDITAFKKAFNAATFVEYDPDCYVSYDAMIVMRKEMYTPWSSINGIGVANSFIKISKNGVNIYCGIDKIWSYVRESCSYFSVKLTDGKEFYIINIKKIGKLSNLWKLPIQERGPYGCNLCSGIAVSAVIRLCDQCNLFVQRVKLRFQHIAMLINCGILPEIGRQIICLLLDDRLHW